MYLTDNTVPRDEAREQKKVPKEGGKRFFSPLLLNKVIQRALSNGKSIMAPRTFSPSRNVLLLSFFVFARHSRSCRFRFSSATTRVLPFLFAGTSFSRSSSLEKRRVARSKRRRQGSIDRRMQRDNPAWNMRSRI